MLDTVVTVAQFIMALGLLVTLHELGHYLAARAFGIKVEKFYLFFDAWGFKLFSFKRGDTEYGIGWLPLGGYVKIAGMIDESLDKDQLASEPQSWEFRSKPAWQRLIVMIGGVAVNLVLGIAIMIGLTYKQGDRYLPMSAINEKGGVYANPIARTWDLQTGDKITAINGKPLERLNDVLDASFLMGSERSLTVDRSGQVLELELPANAEEQLGELAQGPYAELPLLSARLPFTVKQVSGGTAAAKGGLEAGDRVFSIDGQGVEDFFSFKEILIDKAGSTAQFEIGKPGDPDSLHRKSYMTISEDGTLGFMPEFGDLSRWEKVRDLDLGSSVAMGTSKSFALLGANASALGKVFSGKTDPKKTVAGPVGIAQMYGSTFDWINFWTLTAMLSLVLALMNILPIPALDGGHVMFLLYEMIARRPVSEKVLYIGQVIGMVLLLSLMVFIFWVDISRALGF